MPPQRKKAHNRRKIWQLLFLRVKNFPRTFSFSSEEPPKKNLVTTYVAESSNFHFGRFYNIGTHSKLEIFYVYWQKNWQKILFLSISKLHFICEQFSAKGFKFCIYNKFIMILWENNILFLNVHQLTLSVFLDFSIFAI